MPLNNLRTFSAAKVVNAVAPFSAVLKTPGKLREIRDYNYIQHNIRPDWTVQVWRKARGPFRLWNVYFERVSS